MKIIILGEPIAKPAHKCGCIRNKPRAYKSTKLEKQMKEIKKQLSREMKINGIYKPYNRSLIVRYTFLFPTNKSDAVGQKNAKLWGINPHISKPDFDNLAKMYGDCGTGILWTDDAIITVATPVGKYYDYDPRVEIEIEENNNMQLDEKSQKVLKVFGPKELREFLRDVSAFWAWPVERINDLVATGEESNKAAVLSAATSLLIEFAQKHSDNLNKIKKLI